MLRTVRWLALGAALSGCCCPIGNLGSSSGGDTPTVAPQTGAPVPAPTATAYDAAFVDSHVGRLREAAGCAGAQHAELGVFCPAATGWAAGTAAPFPIGERAFLGVTTWVPTQGDVAGAFLAQRRFSVLAVNSQGGLRADLVSPSAQNPFDTAPTTALNTVLGHLRGTQAAPIPIPFGIYEFASARTRAPMYTLATTPTGWQLQGGSFADVRRVGDRWVAVEVPRESPAGLYFTVFVDAEYRRQGF